MGDAFFFFIKDMLIVRPPVKSSLVLRISVVAFVMVCGVFMCSIGLKQISSFTKAGFVDIRVVERPCEVPNVESWERPYVHFPKPTTFSRAECSCNPVRYFVIASTQRSGSGWFETLLNSHMNVSSNGEIFSVKPRRSNMSTIVDTLDRIYNLDWLTSASKNECTAAVGLKWMLNQGLMQNHEAIVDYFSTKGVSMIFLFRRNLLRRRISILANAYDQSAKPLDGKHKSHVHSPDEAKILASYKPSINTTLLIPELQQADNMVKQALEYFNTTRHIILYYEDIIKNHTVLNDVQDFLRIPRMGLKSRQVKIHKGPLREQVENWGDIQKFRLEMCKNRHVLRNQRLGQPRLFLYFFELYPNWSQSSVQSH
ncbi:P-loop containing nucleoside triphosphate hydrolases superfamily protein [Artemisia annua]|uniref:P-loop containing nucleoside triphosphate hydrolases superfamily protein n=1 Tax=Artemisia annua TaxID=35608 RepID=A0A2U1PVH7_ARTAN|nr:P-loop containing nucleoside triphosphate hydrolases superfamily protein [Artemisia annua]